MSAAGPAVALASRGAARRRWPAEALPLARIEAWRLLRHPVLLFGLAITGLFFRDAGDGATLRSFLDGFAFLPLATATLITANLAALRSRRDRTDELYDSLPRPRSSRTTGQLLAVLGTLPICAALIVAALVDNSSVAHNLSVPFTPGFLELAQGPVMVLACGTIGILLARIAPTPIAGALLALAFIALRFSLNVGQMHDPGALVRGAAWIVPVTTDLIEYAPSTGCSPQDAAAGCLVGGVSPAAIPWHLGCLVALSLVAGAAALIAPRRRLAIVATGALMVTLAVGTRLAAG